MGSQLENLLPIGYKRINKVPLTCELLGVRSPVSPLLAPFVSSTLVRSLPDTRVKVFRCLLRASAS